MIRKILLSAFIFLAVAILLAGYFFLERRTIKPINPLSAISQEAALILYSSNASGMIGKFLHENIYWEDFSATSSFSGFHRKLSFIDSLINHDEIFSEWLRGNDIYLSLYPTNRGVPATLILINAGSVRQIKQIGSSIKTLTKTKANISERNIKGIKITDVELTHHSDLKGFSFAFANGLMLISENSVVLEEALNVIDTQYSIMNDEVFRKVYATAGKNVDANLFLNFGNLSSLFKSAVSDQKASSIDFLANLAEWGETDIHIRNDGILLSGFSHSKASDSRYLELFTSQEPVRLSIDRIVPANASAFISLGISHPDQFRRDYMEFLNEHDQLSDYNNRHGAVLQQYQIDMDAAFYEFTDGEVALALNELGLPKSQMHSYLIFSTKSRSMALTSLSTLIQQDAKNKGKSESEYKRVFQMDSQTRFDIYSMPLNYFGELLLGDIFSGIETRYFTFIDNYLVFGNTFESLTFLLRENALNKTLLTDMSYSRYSELIPNKSNLCFYLGVTNARELISQFLRDGRRKTFLADFETFRKIQAVTLQYSAGRNMMYQNMYAGFRPYLENKPLTTWETGLDAAVSMKPYLVKNHNTGENEIFVQDILNNIYLINRAGRVLWKKQLPESIMSEVFQIDFYKNRKLQYLFNTKNFLYLIDRNGDVVDKYPVRLPAPASGPLSVFDYEGNKDYRLFVATEDRKILALSKEGNTIRGWEFERTENLVTTPVQHIKIGTRDYIVVIDQFKTYILDRRGNHRVRVQQNFQKSERSPLVFEPRSTRNEARLVTTDQAGNVWIVYFDGKVDSISFGDYSENHFFDYQDINADGQKDFIFIDENRVQVFRSNKSELFSYQFVNTIDLPSAYYQFGANDRKLGVVDRKDNQIYLFNGNGSIYRGFPLKGRTPFTIGYLKQPGGSFNLLVGSEGNLLFNYTVN
jgi:hypothetical protein